KLGVDKAGKVLKQLISWTDLEDPSLGLFSFSLRLDPNGSSEYILEWNRSQVYWSSGVWDGNTFVFVPELKLNNVFNFSFVSNENETYFTYSRFDASLMSHFVINSTGQIQQLTWLSSVQPWGLFWAQPASLSNVYAFCGPFGIYDDNSSNIFDCPKGFELFSDTQTRLNVWSGGCLRKHPLQCGNLNGKGEWFLKIPNIKFPVGYMSPEYAMEGLYSIKSDVFSFGVLLLEIVSGKKNTGFYNHGSLNLLRYVCSFCTLLFFHGFTLIIYEYPSSTSTLVRYINIGLLCVRKSS
ncbi:hypothetical protein CIPAW_06G130200, partial [Carya illinoinensis]